jgi:phosphate transport system permease protein
MAAPADVIVLPDEEHEVAVKSRLLGPSGITCLLAAAASSLSIVWLLFHVLAPLTGAAGFLLAWAGLFVLVFWLISREVDGPVAAGDRVMGVIVSVGGVAIILPLVLIVSFVVWKGLQALHAATFTQDMFAVGPSSTLSQGGISHAIVGTLEQVFLAVVISIPLALTCAIFLNEVGGPLRRPVRIFVDAMSGVPTIIAGLFIYATWILGITHNWSGFAASLAISISMLPVVTRSSEEVLRLVPNGLREASLALGASDWKTTRRVVLPTALGGLITSAILGVARAVGETAPLIMTAFGAFRMNTNPFSGPQSALPLFVYRGISSGQPSDEARAWTAALVLIVLVLTLFTLARFLGYRASRGGRLRRAPERIR